ncbi:MAG: glucan ABC transporter ATP-binding protein/ permease [Alphaproteobacteria bacterium]|nr:glucan ABC transporter ATP-binding protein/ permease [Alphaproteobacteria bacterium]
MSFVHVYRRALGLLRAERGLAIVLGLANLALAGLAFVEPLLFGRIIDLLATGEGRPPGERWTASLEVMVLWAGIGCLTIAANILVALHADRLAHRRRLAEMARYFEHVLNLSLAFHGRHHSGRLLKVLIQGTDHLFGLWLAFFREHLATLIGLVLLLPLSLFLEWRLGLLLVCLLPVFAVLTALVIARAQHDQGVVEEYHTDLAARASDALGNVTLLQSFTRLQAEAAELRLMMARVLAAQLPVLNWWAMVTVISRMAGTVTLVAIFLLGTWLNIQGIVSIGEIVTFAGFATLLIGKLDHTMGFVNSLFFQKPALEQFFDVVDQQASVSDRPGAEDLGRARGAVRFEDVSFSYGDGTPAVAHVSFGAEPGETVALVGQTGAGKSTTLALLLRLHDPESGRITVDGRAIADLTLDSLRRNIGVVFQDSNLLHRSIADNLRLGRPDASVAEMIAAARLAEAHDFIQRSAQGYDTLVGERGQSLSGGERQRLSIARALLKNPPILILDEATSALDSATESLVQKALASLMRARTTFVIAHRLSTVRHADQILVFKEGRIVERGTFRVLMDKRGYFAELVETQLEPAEAGLSRQGR